MIYLRQVLEDEPLQTDGAKKDRARLDRAALDLATIENPELNVEAVLDRLNDLASRLGRPPAQFQRRSRFRGESSRLSFRELGFHGNQEDYFDPLNSCLNQVLERRTGIPITLSVFYMEIARRLAMPVFRNRPAAALRGAVRRRQLRHLRSIRSTAGAYQRR
jgi:regulator of sirC expression with transglutaminase-like and TPR domain